MENKSCCSGDNSNKQITNINSKMNGNMNGKIIDKIDTFNINPIFIEKPRFELEKSCCSSTNLEFQKEIAENDNNDSWITGKIPTSIGKIPQVSTHLTFNDTFGTWKARWGINRMNYTINPGLYAIGNPDNTSHVLVSANYKLTFDALRKELSGLNLWLLILDTKGINVWCAAGKGTFGTKELVSRIEKTGLKNIITHNTLILPQLGAPGVSAHEVTKKTGLKVIYGPVRASDIKEFLNSGMVASPKMREVKFTFYDRLVLTPIELVSTLKISLMIFGAFFLLNLVSAKPLGIIDFNAYLGAILTGCVITPILLPWIPGRAFAWKGWIVGLLWAVSINALYGWPYAPSYSLTKAIAYLLILPSISSFLAMSFTGSSTYTSLSGVLKEMKIAVPLIVTSIGIGIILILLNTL